MSTNSSRNDDNQEVDLSAVTQGVKNFFVGLNSFFYKCIRFAINNVVILGILVILGAVLGYFVDKSQQRIYSNQIIVTPNFGSTDYLYSKISLIESRLEARDTVFLKAIGFTNPSDMLDIKISPIIDIFKYVNNSGSEINYKMVELMAQDGDIKKVITDNMTSKNYPYHTISFVTRGKTTTEETVAPLLKYLNDNEHYRKIQRQYIKNVYRKLKSNDVIIGQIDAVLNNYSKMSGGGSQVSINENSQLNDVIKTKDLLVEEQGMQKIDLVGLDKVVKDNSTIINIKEKTLVGKLKFVLPLIFIGIFLLVSAFRSFYKKQSLKHAK